MADHTHAVTHETAERPTITTIIGGSLIEGFAGIAASVLAILGLGGILPPMMLNIATIVIGGGLLFDGLAISARLSRLLEATEEETVFQKVVFGSGVNAQTIGGIAGLVLGILALVGLFPNTFPAIAVLVFGVSMVLGSGLNYRLNTMEMAGTFKFASLNAAREIVGGAADLQVLVGLSSIVLGILALIGIYNITLLLAALLSIGMVDSLSSSALSWRFWSLLRK